MFDRYQLGLTSVRPNVILPKLVISLLIYSRASQVHSEIEFYFRSTSHPVHTSLAEYIQHMHMYRVRTCRYREYIHVDEQSTYLNTYRVHICTCKEYVHVNKQSTYMYLYRVHTCTCTGCIHVLIKNIYCTWTQYIHESFIHFPLCIFPYSIYI